MTLKCEGATNRELQSIFCSANNVRRLIPSSNWSWHVKRLRARLLECDIRAAAQSWWDKADREIDAIDATRPDHPLHDDDD